MTDFCMGAVTSASVSFLTHESIAALRHFKTYSEFSGFKIPGRHGRESLCGTMLKVPGEYASFDSGSVNFNGSFSNLALSVIKSGSA